MAVPSAPPPADGDADRAGPANGSAADPEMTLAWSALACSYSFLGDDTRARAAVMKARESLDRVGEAERRWIELDEIWVTTATRTSIWRRCRSSCGTFR